MMTLSATDLAIATAIKSATLETTRETGRYGEYIAINDEVGIIEVALDMQEARERIADIMRRIA